VLMGSVLWLKVTVLLPFFFTAAWSWCLIVCEMGCEKSCVDDSV